MDGDRLFAKHMDLERQKQLTYEYLCHLEEAKLWISDCIREELPSTIGMEEWLRPGVYLAKLAHFFAPQVTNLKKIYDSDHEHFVNFGVQFRHTENSVQFINALNHIRLPKIFIPETTDIYDKKNMPKVIYSIHALSITLYKRGIAPLIQDLYGKLQFSDSDIETMNKSLMESGVKMPVFNNAAS